MAFPPGAPAPQPAEATEEPKVVTVTCNPDGSYTLETDDAEPVTTPGVAEACKALEQMLGGAADPKAAWAAEAAKRDPSGMPAQAAAGPSMSM